MSPAPGRHRSRRSPPSPDGVGPAVRPTMHACSSLGFRLRRRRANEFRLDDDGDLVADPQVAARRRDAVGDTEVAPTQHAMSGEAHAGLGIHRMAKITACLLYTSDAADE